MAYETVTVGQKTCKKRTLPIAKRWGWTLFSIFVIAALVEPDYIYQAQGLVHFVFYISKYIATVFVVLLYFIQRPKLNGFLLGSVIFEAMLLLSTCINSANIMDWVKDSAYVIVFGMFLQVSMKIDRELLLRSLSMILGFYVNINTLSKMMYPNGMFKHAIGYTNCWFLGYDNVACAIILVAVTVSLFRILLYHGRKMIWDWSVVFSGVWFIFALNVATCVIAMVAFFSLMVLTKFDSIRAKIGNARLIIVGMIGLFLFLQFLFTQYSELFSLLFLVLKKDITLSHRVQLWQKAWPELRGMSVLFGLGIHDGNEYIAHFGARWIVHLHCYYLQVIYEGGLVAFGALLGWLFSAAKRFDKTSHNYCTMALLAGLLAIMIVWQVDAYTLIVRYFVVVLFLFYNAGEFEALELVQPRKRRLVFGASR